MKKENLDFLGSWLFGTFIAYLLWVILDLIVYGEFKLFFFFLYWDIMLAFAVILFILIKKRKKGVVYEKTK